MEVIEELYDVPVGVVEAPRERIPVADPYPWGQLTGMRALAEGLNDAIKSRISTENRVKRGGAADVAMGDKMIKLARGTENEYRSMLRQQYEMQVPDKVQEWAASIPGIASGELFPKLLGLLGHPRIAIPYRWDVPEEGSKAKRVLVPDGEPYERSLRQLWQYCGCGDPKSKPRKGATQADLLRAGKLTVIRPVLYTFSTYLVMQHKRSEAVLNSKYYKIYAQAKIDAAANVHDEQCQNSKPAHMQSNGCGTRAHPELGAPGSQWRPGHVNGHGHRLVAKEFFRDLFEVSAL
jgi:hypothetical protein